RPAPSPPGRSTETMKATGALLRTARWALIGATAVFALIGLLYVTRGTVVRHVQGVGADGSPVSPHEPQFPQSVTMLTGATLAPGHRVEILLNGDETFERLWEDLRSARRSIILQLYYGQGGRVAETLRDILLERAAAGVRVFVLYDAFGFQRIPPGHSEAFRDAGVTIVPFRPLRLATLHLAQNRSHVRAVLIDGRIGWTGGFGLDDKWLGDGVTNGSWRETNVRFEGPAVRQLLAAVAAAWVEATGVLFSGRLTPATSAEGNATAGLLHAAPTMGSTTAERFFALSIAAAARTLYITNAYFVPDDNFVGLLAESARRGVDVRVLTAGPRTDLALVRLAGRRRYDALLAAGVRIYEWQPTTLHAKTFVVDGLWATVGSMNFDNRSLVINDEATLMVLDPHVGARMNAIFTDDLRHAREIDAARFRTRWWTTRAAESVAGLLARLL
ncbi:MAG TPA: phospholipase D-like domain-containing protein, partial [Methylomirabilota bacterium]